MDMTQLEWVQQVDFFEEEDHELNISDNGHDVRHGIEEIIVASADWTTETILNQLVRGNIKLNPRFQRRDAWTIVRKSRFIESLILGFPVPQIVLAADSREKGKFVVLDGKQRLLTILQFYGRSDSAQNLFSLKDLEFISYLNNKNFEALQRDIEVRPELDSLDNQSIRTTLIRNWKSESFLHKIFLRLNVENTPLSTQELRQALHPGKFINFLDDQSVKSQSLRKIFKTEHPDFRMRDVDLLLRYVAFHYFLSEYRGNLKEFLDMTCDRLNKNWDEKSEEIKLLMSQFEAAVGTTIKIFGEKTFSRLWMPQENKYRPQFNRAILDVMAFYFTDPNIREESEQKQSAVKTCFQALCEDTEFRQSVEGTTKSIGETYTRLSLWGEALANVLDTQFNVPRREENKIIFSGLR